MAKKSTSKKQKKKTSKNAWLKNPAVRPLLILGIVVVGAAVALIASNLKPDPFEGARKASDAFMQAFVDCDFKTAQKYYLVFKTNDEKANQYKAGCVKGAAQYSFDKQLGSVTEKKDGVDIKNVGFLYNYSQKGQYTGKLMVYMEWLGDKDGWGVFSVTPTTLDPSTISSH